MNASVRQTFQDIRTYMNGTEEEIAAVKARRQPDELEHALLKWDFVEVKAELKKLETRDSGNKSFPRDEA